MFCADPSELLVSEYDKFQKYPTIEPIRFFSGSDARDDNIINDNSRREVNKFFADLTAAIEGKNRKLEKLDQGDNFRVIRSQYDVIGTDKSLTKIFDNKAGLKLANIMAVFSSHISLPQSPKILDIAGGPGGFVKYFHHTYPSAQIKGITYKQGIDWESHISPLIDADYGPDNTGNILTNIDYYRNMNYQAHIITADVANTEVAYQTASANYLLLEASIKIALANLNQGGIFICKIFEPTAIFSYNILNILFQCFVKSTVFRPYSGFKMNGEYYFIGIGYENQHFNPIKLERRYGDITVTQLSSSVSFCNSYMATVLPMVTERIEMYDRFIGSMKTGTVDPPPSNNLLIRELWRLP